MSVEAATAFAGLVAAGGPVATVIAGNHPHPGHRSNVAVDPRGRQRLPETTGSSPRSTTVAPLVPQTRVTERSTAVGAG